MDLKQAYKVMGVSKGVTHKELEKQYLLWIRIHKAQLNQGHDSTQNNRINMDEITSAFHLIEADIISAKKR